MCIAIPGKIIKIKNNKATIEQQDHTHEVDLCLLQDKDVKVGDYLLSHAELALHKLTKKEAEEIIELVRCKNANH